jgi:transcriptional regulator with XRE-family HTH domain
VGFAFFAYIEGMKDIRDHICGIIDKQMDSLGLSPQSIADATGDTPNHVYRWRKNTLPRTQKIPILCELLQVTPNELFGFEDAYDRSEPKIQKATPKEGVMEDSIRRMYEERIEELRQRIEKQDSYIADLQKTVDRETRRSEKLEDKLEKTESVTEKLQVTSEKQQEKITSLLQEISNLKDGALRVDPDSRQKASGE